MRGRRSLGKELEEILEIKQKAERNTKLAREDFTNLSIRTAEQVCKQLTKLLEQLNQADVETKTEIAEDIYKLLVESDLRKLEKYKDNYDGWKDLNDKFNS